MYKSSVNSWGLVAKIFHWIVALLIIWQLFTGFNLSTLEFSPQKIVFIELQKIFGTFILIFILFRLGWRFYNTTHQIKIFLNYIVLFQFLFIISYIFLSSLLQRHLDDTGRWF